MKEVNVKYYDARPGQAVPAGVYRVPAHSDAQWENPQDWHWVHADTVPAGTYYVPRGAEGDVTGPCGVEPSSPRWVSQGNFPREEVRVFEVGGKRTVGDGVHQGSWVPRQRTAR